MADAKPIKKKLTVKHYILFGVVALGLIGALSSRHSGPSSSNDSPQVAAAQGDKSKEKLMRRIERQNKEAKSNGLDADCTALQLYREYRANEVSADAKYKGKWVQVRGKLLSVAKDISDAPYLALAADAYGVAQVQAHLFEVQPKNLKKESFVTSPVTEVAAALKPGQNVTVECLGKGVMLTIPQLDQCVIIPD